MQDGAWDRDRGYERIETWIETEDGVPLAASAFEPVGPARATVLMLPGIGVPRRVFAPLGVWLARRGLRALSIDYRGTFESKLPGASGGAAPPSLTAWGARDAVAAFRYAERTWSAPVAILGHSFGGQLLGLADDFRRASAIACVATQFGWWRNWSGYQRARVFAFWHAIVPLAAALGPTIPPWVGLGVPLPSGAAREWARWGRRRDYLIAHIPGSAERFAALDMPVRVYHFPDDDFAPERGVKDFVSRLTGTRVERRLVAPEDLGAKRIGHFGFMRSEIATPLWEEVAAFFDGVPPRRGRNGSGRSARLEAA